MGDSGITVKGEKIEFQDINGVKRGTIYGVTTGAFAMYAPDFILLMPGASGTKINSGPLFPGADGVQSLGTVNTRWRYFVPISTVASRPAASSSTHGLIWRTREGVGSKTYIWICAQNDANNYEWVQIGVST